MDSEGTGRTNGKQISVGGGGSQGSESQGPKEEKVNAGPKVLELEAVAGAKAGDEQGQRS